MRNKTRVYQKSLAAGLILLTAVAARAQDLDTPRLPSIPTQSADQVIYKGVVGNLLETIPIDPARRVELQRGNAVVSNVLSGRSLAVLFGIASPILMVGGLIWGIWAASQIKAPAPETGGLASTPGKPGLGFCADARSASCLLRIPDAISARASEQKTAQPPVPAIVSADPQATDLLEHSEPHDALTQARAIPEIAQAQ